MKRGRSLAPLDGTVSRSLRGRAPLSRVAPTASYQVRPQLSNFGACAASGGFPVPLVTTSAQELPLLQVAGEPSLGSQDRGRTDLPELRAPFRGSMAGARAVLDDDKLKEHAIWALRQAFYANTSRPAQSTFTLSKSGRSWVWRRPCGRVPSRVRTRTWASCG